MDSRRAWFVYIAAAFAYFASVLQRTSLGVAGLDAQDRFVVSAAVLSTLAVCQVIVYAGLQIPVGIVLDRVGPRALLIFGAAFMAGGQFLLAFTSDFPVALTARVLVGIGDAVTFNSALRLVTSWFSPPKATALMQITGTIGQLGQLLSALPFALLLGAVGWQPAFLSAASVSVLAFLLVVVGVVDSPRGVAQATATRLSLVFRRLRITVARPGTWLAFWVHFVTVPGGSVIGLLWGMPMLQEALGFPHAIAATLLMVPILSGIVAGPILGIVTSRLPQVRVGIAAGTSIAIMASWGILAGWPGTPPGWFVVVHLVVIGLGGPASVIAFDLARSTNPNNSLGVANGVVNVGGFTSSFVMLFLVGLVLDWMNGWRIGAGGASNLYSFDSFRVAFVAMQVVPLLGLVLLGVTYRGTRRRGSALVLARARAEAERNNVAPSCVEK